MTVKLLTEHHLEILRLKGGCTGSSESTHVKMPHCWKSHVTAHIKYFELHMCHFCYRYLHKVLSALKTPPIGLITRQKCDLSVIYLTICSVSPTSHRYQ